MRRRYSVALLITALLITALAAEGCHYASRPSSAAYPKLKPDVGKPAPGSIKVTFLGTATLLFSDGETSLMTDGFFTRPSLWELATEPVKPDASRIDRSLREAGVTTLAAILVAHSHYDHAMDSPSVAKRTGAVLVGSTSTANIGRGQGLPESAIRSVEGSEQLQFGQFNVRTYRALHAPEPVFPGDISAPLHMPANLSDFKEGGSRSYLISNDGVSLLVQASANFIPGAYKGVHADVVFLGTGLLGKQSETFVHDYWREVVLATGAKLVVPIHWDDFTIPAKSPELAPPLVLDDFARGMDMIERLAQRDGVAVRMMVPYEAVSLSPAFIRKEAQRTLPRVPLDATASMPAVR